MSDCRRDIPTTPAFVQRGLKGYQFPLQVSGMEMYAIDVQHGHDDFVLSPTITHIYYVLQGSGHFVVDETHIPVSESDLIEILPKRAFAYSGRMKLLLIMSPPFSRAAIEVIGPNRDVP